MKHALVRRPGDTEPVDDRFLMSELLGEDLTATMSSDKAAHPRLDRSFDPDEARDESGKWTVPR